MEIKNSKWKLKILDGNPEKEIKNSGWKLKILDGNPEILEIEIQSPLLNVRVHIAPKLDLQVACLNLVGHRPIHLAMLWHLVPGSILQVSVFNLDASSID